jgi:hypothetical protein
MAKAGQEDRPCSVQRAARHPRDQPRTLKLNVSAANALADISARVNQVLADLPPEAEVPAINIEPSDAQIAAMYLSFGSTILEDNQVTDYLIRVVQPRLSARLRRGQERRARERLRARAAGEVAAPMVET